MSRPEAHIDLDDLALLALGESVPGGEHVGGCGRCQAELDQIAATVMTVRQVTEADLPSAPAPAVWERIQRELHPEPPARSARPDAVSRRSGRAARRSWTLFPGLAAGAAAAVVGIAIVASPGGEPGQVIAAAPMAALEESGIVGEATVVQAEGDRSLAVSLTGLAPQPGAFYEVWLIAPDVSRMVSLGVVSGDGATLPVPAGLDLAGYPIVDISLEPMDGDPVHSKVSLSRGELAV